MKAIPSNAAKRFNLKRYRCMIRFLHLVPTLELGDLLLDDAELNMLKCKGHGYLFHTPVTKIKIHRDIIEYQGIVPLHSVLTWHELQAPTTHITLTHIQLQPNKLKHMWHAPHHILRLWGLLTLQMIDRVPKVNTIHDDNNNKLRKTHNTPKCSITTWIHNQVTALVHISIQKSQRYKYINAKYTNYIRS